MRSFCCSNLLEHVADRASIRDRLIELRPPNGILLISCTHRYPKHDDPFDNGFRPATGDLHALFPGTEMLVSDTIAGGTYYDALGRSPYRLTKEILRACLPFYAPRRWLGTVRHLAWLSRPVAATCVSLRKR